MSASEAWAVVCGLGLGVGLWVLVLLLPGLARVRLVDRVAPYVLDVSAEARVWAHRGARRLALVGALLAVPVVESLLVRLAREAGSDGSLRRRLARAGSRLSPERYRLEQVVWALVGMAVGALAALAPGLVAAGGVLRVVVVAFGAAGGAFARHAMLDRAIRARARRIAQETPAVLELLALSLSAGEGILDALRRVARVGRGALADELRLAVAEAATGVPLATALQAVSERVGRPIVERCVAAVLSALERGAPLAEVLRAQAQDARVEFTRELIESAGRKEIVMLMPLVFFILPVTVLFAILPGVVMLRVGF